MEIDLEKGIQIISNTISLLNDDADYPYFFIVGAGVSVPEIPTASNIIKKCKDIVKKRNEAEYQEAVKSIKIRDQDSEKEYSSWIEKAFPNPINRSNFYKSLIKNAKISSANLMLAQILHSKIITNTIFTTNFDDKIEQALTLIGTKDYFSSENKSDNLVVNVNSDEVQIVHVHGTYRFYDIANLTSEISEVSTQNGTVSSSQLLKSFLQGRAPIVLGYSGWENDVIMKSIKERLVYAVPYNYIWVCYSRNDYIALPDWLKKSRNVYFIVPPENLQQCDESVENVYKNDKKSHDSQIPATLFLGKLISQLKIPSPEIFVNPYQYFSSLVEETLPVSDKVLHLKHWAQRMQYHASHESEAEKKINDLEVAIIGKDFEKICSVLLEFSKMKLDKQDIQFLSKCISGELLEDKRIIKTVPCKRDLLFAVLTFAEANEGQLKGMAGFSRLLYEIISVDFKHSEQSDYIEILNKIIALTESTKSEDLLDVNLTALGTVAFLTKEQTKKLAMYNKLLSEIPSNTKNKKLRYTESVTLLYKCEMADDAETISLIERAEKICKDYSLDSIKPLLFQTKAEAIRKIRDIRDEKFCIEWAQECLNYAMGVSAKEDMRFALRVTREISRIPRAILSKMDGSVKTIMSILDKCDSSYIDENCYVTLTVAEIYANLIDLVDNPATKWRYCKDILSFEEKFRPERLDQECIALKKEGTAIGCDQYQDLRFKAHMTVCTIPLVLVPDEIKIKHLQQIKDAICNSEAKLRCYRDALLAAAESGDENFYSDSVLSKDYEYAVKINELNKKEQSAINDYMSKNYAEAERKFLDILRSDKTPSENTFKSIFEKLLDDAQNNLAFMVRRGETTTEGLNVENLLSNVSDDNIFKHMNLFLYYLANQNFNMEKVQQAYDIIRKASPKDMIALTFWWDNEEVVGRRESVLVMAILQYIQTGAVPQIDLNDACAQYNMNAVQSLFETGAQKSIDCEALTCN